MKKFLLPVFLTASLLAACAPLPLSTSVTPPKTASGSRVQSSAPLAASGSLLEIGSGSAAITLLLVDNPSCAYCREVWEQDVPRLQADFITPGTLRLEVATLPMKKYPESEQEARALYCAAVQGKGAQMHGALFDLPQHTDAALLNAATALGLDVPTFRTCLTSPEASTSLHEQQALEKKWKITLAPTLILEGEKKVGLQSYADLRGWIEVKLEK